jgi:hypothetical protein
MVNTATTTLTIAVQYDPARIDPEGLASVLDRLLETACSTPGILAECSDPLPGPFSVPDAALYQLRLDGSLLRRQRRLLEELLGVGLRGGPRVPQHDDAELLQGVVELLDEIADPAHDQHGIDCLEPDDECCDCERPGYFCSGVPGILAHIENGRLAPGAKVERCDLCRRYCSDEAALEKLRQLGMVPS